MLQASAAGAGDAGDVGFRAGIPPAGSIEVDAPPINDRARPPAGVLRPCCMSATCEHPLPTAGALPTCAAERNLSASGAASSPPSTHPSPALVRVLLCVRPRSVQFQRTSLTRPSGEPADRDSVLTLGNQACWVVSWAAGAQTPAAAARRGQNGASVRRSRQHAGPRCARGPVRGSTGCSVDVRHPRLGLQGQAQRLQCMLHHERGGEAAWGGGGVGSWGGCTGRAPPWAALLASQPCQALGSAACPPCCGCLRSACIAQSSSSRVRRGKG
jgi:hypothetical protein